jgi:alpha-tubulin suppressor-like RCC1 family protein
MGWSKFKSRMAVGLIFLALGVLTLLTTEFVVSIWPGRLRLPVGQGTPAISLGERHGLILASDGSLWSWGSDFLGWPVLGQGKASLKSTILRRVGHDTNWVSLSAGENHNLAVKSDGTLWTWGESVQGGRLRPIYTPAPAAPGNDWKQAAAGGIISVALKKDGTLWAWGNNWAGSLGIGSTNSSAVPVQVGSSTNWTKVWAGLLETVALQSDGSLWYWGENPNPAVGQGTGQIVAPKRISPDTNWVDVGFGVNTVFAIKSDGTLWTWGRQADRYTGATNTAQDAIPSRVGTNSDWRSLCATTGWWCNGLIKKDGSLWFMDASEGKPNGPRTPYQPVQFRRIDLEMDYVAFAAGATHAAGPGVHGPIGVILTRDGEVWTWGMVLGDPPTLKSGCQALGARMARLLLPRKPMEDPTPDAVYRDQPWQLRNTDAN